MMQCGHKAWMWMLYNITVLQPAQLDRDALFVATAKLNRLTACLVTVYRLLIGGPCFNTEKGTAVHMVPLLMCMTS